jgi:biopolymer transport protein ExbD
MISFARPESDNLQTYTVNIALFVDLVLVFIIIFIVVAPLAAIHVVSDLPSSNAPTHLPASTAEPQPRPERPLYLTVKSDLTLALGDNPVSRDLLPSTLDAAANGNKDTRIFFRADKAVPYGEVMEVMNLLRAAGYLNAALVGTR